MSRLHVVIALAIVVAPFPTMAQRVEARALSKELLSCLNSDQSQTTDGRNHCMQIEGDNQATRMQSVLKARLVGLRNEDDRNRLIRVQRAWERWRDARCGSINSDPLAGSEANVEAAFCEAETTADRADELEAMARPFTLSR